MAYTKQTWKNRRVARPRTYTRTENGDGTVTLTPAPGSITEQGSPVNAERMTHIEEGVHAAAAKADANELSLQVLGLEMQTFTHLAEGSTTGDAELTNIRAGYNGTLYNTAGEAVRGQVGELSTILEGVPRKDYNPQFTAAEKEMIRREIDAADANNTAAGDDFAAVLNALDGTIRRQYLLAANMTDNRYWKLEDGEPVKTGTSSTAQKCWEPIELPAGTYTYYRIVGSYSYVDDGESITKLRTTTGTNTDPITVTFENPVTLYISASNTSAGNGAMLCSGSNVPDSYAEGVYSAELARIDALEDSVEAATVAEVKSYLGIA